MEGKAPVQAQYGIATAASKLDCVQIDGLVVLKIIKHSRDEGNPIEMVSGQLLGMDITQNDTTTLEVKCVSAVCNRVLPCSAWHNL